MDSEKIKKSMRMRHQFLYGYNNEENHQFVKNLTTLYPIKFNEDADMAILLNSIGIPNVESDKQSKEDLKLKSIAREYLNLTIAYNILVKMKKDIEPSELSKRILELLSFVSVRYLDKEYPKITSIDELLIHIKYSQIMYLNEYQKYLLGYETVKMNNIPIKFIDLSLFINHTKRMMRNNSGFHLITPLEKDISPISVMAINSIIATKYNRDISVEILCEPGKWPTYETLDNHKIEYVHDYGIVELDDSYEHYKKLTKRLPHTKG